MSFVYDLQTALLKLLAASLPFTATAAFSVGGESLPLTYALLGALALVSLPGGLRLDLSVPSLWLLGFACALVVTSALAQLLLPELQSHAQSLLEKLIKQSVTWGGVVLHFMLLSYFFRRLSWADYRTVIRWAVIGLAAVSAYSLYQFVGLTRGWPGVDVLRNSQLYSIFHSGGRSGWSGTVRASAFAPEPSMWAGQIVSSLGLLWFIHGRWKRGAVALLMGLSLLLTFSRVGWLALAFMPVVLAIAQWRTIRAVAVPIFLGLGAALYVIASVETDVWQRLLAFTDRSVRIRLETQLQALELWLQHPLIGIGYGSFGLFTSGESVDRVTFNFYLTLAVGTGVLGLGLFLGFLFSIYHRLQLVFARVRHHPRLRGYCLGMLMVLAGTVIVWGGVPGFNFSYIWFLLALAATLPSQLLERQRSADRDVRLARQPVVYAELPEPAVLVRDQNAGRDASAPDSAR